jgi:hypothetical protein
MDQSGVREAEEIQLVIAFSSEVDLGSRKENASKQQMRMAACAADQRTHAR